MSLKHVKTFYEKIAKDESFRAQVQGATSKDECSQIVKSAGYDFSQEEFEEYTLQLLESTANEGEIQDLSEKELAAVVGGVTTGLVGSLWPYMVAIYGLPSKLFWK